MSEALIARACSADALLEGAIVEGVSRCWPAEAAPLRALVLAGSLAREEGSWLPRGAGTVLLGDAELLCVVPDGARLPPPDALAPMLARVDERLHELGISAHVTFTPVGERYLRTLPAHIFGYELRHTGRVLWGDANCLALIPGCSATELPRSDAWRLLTNRVVELLPALGRPAGSAVSELYPWVKLYLDMATSYLVFTGGYVPGYARRAERLRQACGRDAWATPALVRQVEACTAWKLAPTAQAPELFDESGFRARALERAERLWCWELEQMTAAPPGTPRPELWRRWLRQQPGRSRWRGWMSAWRHGGAPARQAARWLWMARRASPRHWIYEAAAEAAFAPPTSARLQSCAACLPYPPMFSPRQPSELAGAVVDNFQRLVESTRA
ncbi:MAG: hypothetical protein ACRD1A_03210 [Terriglobales bacterium]